MSKKIGVGDAVWKKGSEGGYEGPGVVVVVFKNWMGQNRYVVSHKIDGGRGYFYHIYGASLLERQLVDVETTEEIAAEEE